MRTTRVGVIEDDPVHAEIVSATLSRAGFEVSVYTTALDFRRHNGAGRVDLVILDWEMPNESGLEFLRTWRMAGGALIPVIFLTAHADEKHIVEGLQAGADDYLVKPAKPLELVARVRSVLRRAAGAPAFTRVEYPPFTIDIGKRRLLRDGEPQPLTPREFDLLLYLFQHSERVVSRESLLTHVWAVGPGVITRAIDTYVSRLRKRVGLDGTFGWKLEGVYQHGYRLSQQDPPAQKR